MLRLVVVAVFCAVLLPAAAFAIHGTPLVTTDPQGLVLWAARAIDFPVAALNQFLPERLHTHMTMSFQCGHLNCFPSVEEEWARYTLVGAAAYLVLFAAGGLTVAGLRELS